MAKIIDGRFIITTDKDLSTYTMGLEVVAFDTLDLSKLGAPKKVLIKQVNGKCELVAKPMGSNLSNYDRLVLVDLAPNHLTASVEETKQFIANPNVIVERVLSSGARFTEDDLKQLPKEAHYLIYKVDTNGARVFNVINVNTNKEYQKYGIKSQVERNVARVLVAYCENSAEMSAMTMEQRQAQYTRFIIKLVEFNDYIKVNPNYKK